MNKTFLIEYTDPETGSLEKTTKEFEDTTENGVIHISAKEWAEDYAYTVADKGWFRVTELKK